MCVDFRPKREHSLNLDTFDRQATYLHQPRHVKTVQFIKMYSLWYNVCIFYNVYNSMQACTSALKPILSTYITRPFLKNQQITNISVNTLKNIHFWQMISCYANEKYSFVR